MRTKRWMATCVVALLSVTAVLAKDIRVVVFKMSQKQGFFPNFFFERRGRP